MFLFVWEYLILPILRININSLASRTMTMAFAFLASFTAKSFCYSRLHKFTIIAFEWFLVIIKRNMLVNFFSNFGFISMTIFLLFFCEDLILPILRIDINFAAFRAMAMAFAFLANFTAKSFGYSSLYTITVIAF